MRRISRGAADARVDLGLFQAGGLEAEGEVLVDRHVRVERVGLEHHGDAALRRRHLVHPLAVEHQRAAGDLLQPGDHPSSVDLPQPEGPTKTANSPGSIRRSMPWITGTLP